MELDPLRIMVIDDNPEILDIVSLMLTRNGYATDARNHVNDFIREVKEVTPDLIIIDQHLGWADGCELCSMLKADATLQHIPVVMFSAYHKTKEQCLFCGADAFLAKPFDMQTLLEIISSLTLNNIISQTTR